MANTPVPDGNNATLTFVNRNLCASFNMPMTTNFAALSSSNCGEVYIYNNTGQGLLVNDFDSADASKNFLIPNGGNMTFRGITNSNQVSAKLVTGTATGLVYCRAQYFSQNVI